MTPAPASPVPVVDPIDPLAGGGRLVSVEGTVLPLTGARLAARAAGGVAEVVLEQRFRNPHEKTLLTVTYAFPLPADAAVSGYAFTIGARRITGEIDRRAAARERFEQALLEGKTAALLEQERSSLFFQELGNIPPGAEVVVELSLDQRLRWLDEGQWEWRFPTTVAPRYQGSDVAIAAGPLPARLTLELRLGDEGAGPAESPSHRLRAGASGVVALGDDGGVPLDRDLVVRWPVERGGPGLALERARTAPAERAAVAHGLLTVVPPAPATRPAPLPRDLIVLLDSSGSMSGEPLAQARRVVEALIDSLTEADRLELIEFSRAPRRWQDGPVPATAAQRRAARAWLAALEAGGGTEMRRGIEEALRPLRPDSQRQVVVVSDGLIGGEAQVLAAIAGGLPAGSRLHTVGVGSAVNRSLTGPAARAGRGVEVVIGLGEDAERAAQRLVARTRAPLVVDLTLSGPALVEHAPRALPDLFAGAPVLVGLALRPEGGTLTVEGRTAAGPWRHTISVPATAPGEGRAAVPRLFARETVEDLELRAAAGEASAPIDLEIERLGLAFGLATRLTSWVAISEEPAGDPGQTRRVRMPHELPFGMSAEGLGLRPAAGAPPQMMPMMMASPIPMMDAAVATGHPRRGMPTMAKMPSPSRPSPPPSTVLPPRGIVFEPAPPPPRRFTGEIVRREGTTLTVRFTVDGADLAWTVGDAVEVTGADGRVTAARVVTASPPGWVRAGETIELTVALAPDAGAELVRLEVTDGPEAVVVVF